MVKELPLLLLLLMLQEADERIGCGFGGRIGDLEDSILLWELPFRDVSKLDFDIT